MLLSDGFIGLEASSEVMKNAEHFNVNVIKNTFRWAERCSSLLYIYQLNGKSRIGMA